VNFEPRETHWTPLSPFLRDRGIEYAVTHAHEATSAPMLEHLGFETLFRGACYQLDP